MNYGNLWKVLIYPHIPQEPGLPVHSAGGMEGAPSAVAGAKVESCFTNWVEPQCGHDSLLQSLERTRSSLDFSQSAQWNS